MRAKPPRDVIGRDLRPSGCPRVPRARREACQSLCVSPSDRVKRSRRKISLSAITILNIRISLL